MTWMPPAPSPAPSPTAALAKPSPSPNVGDGKRILTGSNSYTGTTTVNDGTLLQNGNYTGGGDFIVHAGGTRGGSGTTNGDLLVNSGTVAPGTSIESLGEFASFTFNGGTCEYEPNITSATAGLFNGGDVGTLTLLNEPILDLVAVLASAI